MGGKSTFLRSVGIATLLAHVGCYVPASVAEVSPILICLVLYLLEEINQFINFCIQ